MEQIENEGIVNFGGKGGEKINIEENYVGNNGIVEINKVMGEDK